MNDVLTHLNGEVTTNGAGGRLLGVGGTHEVSDHLEGLARSLNHQEQCRTAGDESDEIVKERLTGVFALVLLGSSAINGA